MKMKGFTLIEILVTILLVSIILMTIVGLYIASDKAFKKNKPISDVLEEMRSGIATLDFVFSRWGVGVPCANNNCTINATGISPCDEDYPPSDPMCMTCNEGSLSSGCSDVEFYGNLYGIGFVVNANSTTGTASIISCRLEYNSDCSKQCYYIWEGGKISNSSWNSTNNQPIIRCLPSSEYEGECISGTTPKSVSFDNSTFPIEDGNIIMRAPHKIRIFLDNDGWIKMERYDSCNNFNSENGNNTRKIAKADSFKVYAEGKTIKVSVTFVSQSQPAQTLSIERYFGR